MLVRGVVVSALLCWVEGVVDSALVCWMVGGVKGMWWWVSGGG